MSDSETSEKQKDRDRRETERSGDQRMPFDTSDLRRIPTATDDDPPYRNWWVGDDR